MIFPILRRRRSVCSALPFSLALFLLLIPAGAPAEEGEEAPETIIITAAPEESASPNVRVIEVEKAVEAGHTTVADAVAATPGVAIQRRGSGFESSTLRIRGSSSEQVLLLRDGQPIGAGSTGISDLSRVSLRGVERIEVILGPATALYGAGGAAGAINLISGTDERAQEREDQIAGSSSFEYGSFEEYRLGGELLAPIGASEIDVAVDGVYAQNEYTYRQDGSAVARENAGGVQGQARVGLTRQGESNTVNLNASVDHSDRGVPGSVEFPSDSARLEESGAAATVALATGGAELAEGLPEPQNASVEELAWGTLSRLTGSREERNYNDPEYPLGALSSQSTLYRLDAGLTARGPLGAGRINLPVSYTFEALGESELGDRERHGAAFAPAYEARRLPLGRSSLGWNVHGRVELLSGAGERELLPSVRTALSWRPSRAPLEASLSVGAGYRLPTYAELFWPAGAFALGNPELRPELSRSAELELLLGRNETHQLRLNTHVTLYRELIQWLPNPSGYWRPRNTGEAITYGGEAAYNIREPIGLSPWTAEAEVTGELLYARDLSEGPTYKMQLPYRPKLTGTLTSELSHLLDHRIGASLRAVGERPVTAQNTVWLDPYLAVDLYAAFAIPGSSVLLRGRVNNLLDQDFLETRFFPNPGRELVLAVEVSW
ncbi:MAG: TonB-dependent receptor plug domain-containing protein [Spirochaetaceae bacterium]